LIFENCRASFAKTPGLTGIDLVDPSWTGSEPLDPDPMAAQGWGAGGGGVAGVHQIWCSRPRFFTGFGLGARGDEGKLDGRLGMAVRWSERCTPQRCAARLLRRAIATAWRQKRAQGRDNDDAHHHAKLWWWLVVEKSGRAVD
jgi:hypothetical protein